MSKQRFGRWEVLSSAGRKWLCLCSCGTRRRVDRYSLRGGTSTSCGCLRAELLADRKATHGMSKTPEYRVWATLVERCSNPDARDYAKYGARGIKVCRRWLSFTEFLADMGRRPTGQRYTVERRDNDKGYNHSNCYWATYSEQARNRQSTPRIGGVPLISLAESAGLTASAVRSRRSRGRPESDLLLAGPKAVRRAQAKREGTGLLANVDGKLVTLKELTETSGIPYNTLKYRLHHNKPLLSNAKSRKEPAAA